MRRFWRISAWPGLGGLGGLASDGRWHTLPRCVLYVAEHPALAMVEVIAHMHLSLTSIPTTLTLIPIDVLDGATESLPPSLPPGWQANEPTSQTVGNAWFDSVPALLMPVPSAILAHSTNYLINPKHPEATTHLNEGTPEAFWFDKRFLR
jgi:RES domain-containing protein